MPSYKPLLTTLFSTGGGAAAWAMIDGVLGTLLALVGVIGGILGLLWGWKSHKAKMAMLALQRQRETLEIERLRGGASGDEANRLVDPAS